MVSRPARLCDRAAGHRPQVLPCSGETVSPWPYGRFVPMKISEIIRLLERDGWELKRVSGSHRHYTHPAKPGLVTVAGRPSATLKPKTESSILKQAGLRRERP